MWLSEELLAAKEERHRDIERQIKLNTSRNALNEKVSTARRARSGHRVLAGVHAVRDGQRVDLINRIGGVLEDFAVLREID